MLRNGACFGPEAHFSAAGFMHSPVDPGQDAGKAFGFLKGSGPEKQIRTLGRSQNEGALNTWGSRNK